MPLEDGPSQLWRYSFPHSDQILEVAPSVIQTFEDYRQTGDACEAGGLLFAEMLLPRTRITEATHPHEKDKRSRFSFIPFRNAQRRTIKACFKRGLHFVGEWHTHPQESPTPSNLDLHSMCESYIKSKHELNTFIMIIVGAKKEQLQLWVSMHNSTGCVPLEQLRP